VSVFVLSPESEDRVEFEVQLGKAQEDLLLFYLQADLFSFAAVAVK
jgi:hypothetical protein